MKQYDSYKDSGVQWIGRIPSHWECASISHLTTSRSGGTPDRQKKEYWDNGTINWMSSGEVNKGMVYDTEEFITKLGSLNSSAKPLPKNSVMIALNGQGKTKGMAAVLKIKAACNQSLCAFSCDNRLHYMYLYYNFKSMYKYLRSQAGDDTRDGLAASFVKKQKIPLPPFTEQESIVNYIDKKCAEIDKAIATQQRRIELLQELRQNIITHAVTRGINPDAPLKDSGVEWIGMVPEHWEVMKTSLIFNNIGSGTTPSTTKPLYYTEEGDGYYWLQTGDLNDGVITDTSKKVTKLAVQECNLKFYPANSVVIAMYGATIGKVGLLSITTSTNQACCVLPKSKFMIEQLALYIYQTAKQPMLIEAMGGGQPNISQDVIKKLKVPVPPVSEQQAIVAHIEAETAKLDKLMSKANRQISLLQELKQSLITEVVTGKRKVC